MLFASRQNGHTTKYKIKEQLFQLLILILSIKNHVTISSYYLLSKSLFYAIVKCFLFIDICNVFKPYIYFTDFDKMHRYIYNR